MFSKRLLTIVCLILFILTNIIFLSISAKHRHPETIIGKMAMAAVAPFQEMVVQTIRFAEHMWSHYFYLVSVKQECDRLQVSLNQAKMEIGRYIEAEQASHRLRRLLEMKMSLTYRLVAGQVVGLDPSGWYKTIIINRGTNDGVGKGMPVISPDGVVGQIVTASYEYAKVMLMIDRSNAIDALIQRNRTRGIVEGESEGLCRFKYVVRKAELEIGDVVVSSGLDQIFPKGLRIGKVESISKTESGIFQDVKVVPFVDFDRLEEVFVILVEPDQPQEDAIEQGLLDEAIF
jgi:rod shape-determining protein MreC